MELFEVYPTTRITIIFQLIIVIIVVWMGVLLKRSVMVTRQSSYVKRTNSKMYAIELVSPMYLHYDGQFATTVAYVNTEEEVNVLSTLVCTTTANPPVDTRTFCKFGSCAYVITKEIEALVAPKNRVTAHEWTLEEYKTIKSFYMANCKQIWYAGVSHPSMPTIITWYRIGRDLEDYIAQNILVRQKMQCIPYYPGTLGKIIPTATMYRYIIQPMPLCGLEHMPFELKKNNLYIDKNDLISTWTPVCKWRARDTDKWRIVSSSAQSNILKVETDDLEQLYIRSGSENTQLTLYLPNENIIQVKSVTPTIFSTI